MPHILSIVEEIPEEYVSEDAFESDDEYDSADEDYPEELNCPWGWCKNNEKIHEDICLHSKFHYGVSWGAVHSRRHNFKWFGYDIWERDANDNVLEPLPDDKFVYPPPDYVPSDDEEDENCVECKHQTTQNDEVDDEEATVEDGDDDDDNN